MKKFFLSIIAPVMNEEEGILHFLEVLTAILQGFEYEIIIIDDGSTDSTLQKLLDYKNQKNPNLKIIEFSRNFGKEAALAAGLDVCKGDIAITMDADLQHPPHLIPEMIKKWSEGYDTVSAVRAERKTDGMLKQSTASLFYKIYNAISETQIRAGEGDFRLFDRKCINALQKLKERTRFNKGLFNWIGFKGANVYYVLPERIHGYTKWKYRKLFGLAMDGILSFSNLPLRLFTYIGFIISSLSFLYAIYIVSIALINGINVPGYPSIITSIFFIGGVIITGIGVLGEYISRIFIESKERPIYLVRNEY